MATMHFNWDALALETPEDQYNMVLQVTNLLSEEAQREFMETDQFYNWLHSAEMDTFLKNRMAQEDFS